MTVCLSEFVFYRLSDALRALRQAPAVDRGLCDADCHDCRNLGVAGCEYYFCPIFVPPMVHRILWVLYFYDFIDADKFLSYVVNMGGALGGASGSDGEAYDDDIPF